LGKEIVAKGSLAKKSLIKIMYFKSRFVKRAKNKLIILNKEK